MEACLIAVPVSARLWDCWWLLEVQIYKQPQKNASYYLNLVLGPDLDRYERHSLGNGNGNAWKAGRSVQEIEEVKGQSIFVMHVMKFNGGRKRSGKTIVII